MMMEEPAAAVEFPRTPQGLFSRVEVDHVPGKLDLAEVVLFAWARLPVLPVGIEHLRKIRNTSESGRDKAWVGM